MIIYCRYFILLPS